MAVIFDFLDGKAARLFDAESKIGIQLDSLADLVSFGVSPAVLMYVFHPTNAILVLSMFLVSAGAFRLARFNALKDKVKGFVGMPITVNGLIFPALYFVNASAIIVSVILALSAVLMVSTLRFKKVI